MIVELFYRNRKKNQSCLLDEPGSLISHDTRTPCQSHSHHVIPFTLEHLNISDLGPFSVVSGVRVGHLIDCYADTSKEMIIANVLMPRKGFAGAVITRYDFFANWMFWVDAGIGSNLTVRKKKEANF